MSTTIPTTGFCIHLVRVRQEQRHGIGFARTVGSYQCFWEGNPMNGLAGQMVERGGPGDNGQTGKTHHRRIHEGTYRLSIQDGLHYKTYRYKENHVPPALLVMGTNKRGGILIHPCHDHDYQYLSSIGCLNPAQNLMDADSRVDLADSRARVIAIIESLKTNLVKNFPKSGAIPDAVVLIEGEPS